MKRKEFSGQPNIFPRDFPTLLLLKNYVNETQIQIQNFFPKETKDRLYTYNMFI